MTEHDRVYVVHYPMLGDEDIIEVYTDADAAEQAREEVTERAERLRDVTLHERKVFSR